MTSDDCHRLMVLCGRGLENGLQPEGVALILALSHHMGTLTASCSGVSVTTIAVEAGMKQTRTETHLARLIADHWIDHEPGRRFPDGTQGINTYRLGPRFLSSPDTHPQGVSTVPEQPSPENVDHPRIPRRDSVIHLKQVSNENKRIRPIPDTYRTYSSDSGDGEIDPDKVETSGGECDTVDDMNAHAERLLAKEPEPEVPYDPFYDDDRERESFGHIERPRKPPAPVRKPAPDQRMSEDEAANFLAEIEAEWPVVLWPDRPSRPRRARR